jgi:hypothetical protein
MVFLEQLGRVGVVAVGLVAAAVDGECDEEAWVAADDRLRRDRNRNRNRQE